ncbi:MAG: hypothetical protein WC975_00565 [Phycisphaerae bacterium]
MAKYIRELLELPSQVHKGDFVLNLAAGVSDKNASANGSPKWPVSTEWTILTCFF